MGDTGGGSNQSNGDTSITRRYAPYIENLHNDFLNNIVERQNIALGKYLYDSYTHLDVDSNFFSIGYTLSSFPSLVEMFGTHMAGLDIEVYWNDSFGKIVKDSNVNEVIEKEIELLDDKTIKENLTKFQLSMRDTNTVTSSSFVVGKAVIEDRRLKSIEAISLNNKVDLFLTEDKNYTVSLNHEKELISTYALLMKGYFISKINTDNSNYKFDTKKVIWPFEAMSFTNAALGTIRGAKSWEKVYRRRTRSTTSKYLSVASDTVTGAQVGFQIGGWVGAIVGAEIGTHVGIAKMMMEEGASVGDYVTMFLLPSPLSYLYI